MPSRYEKNIRLQPRLIRAVLAARRPAWMEALRRRRITFVGIGTNYHAARIAQWLWRKRVSAEAYAVPSFDFVRMPQPVGRGDVVVVLSHRGTKSFTVESAAAARRAGAVTVGITGRASPLKPLTHRIESCEMEDTGAFTKSLTTTLGWIVRWMGDPELESGLGKACGRLMAGPAFPRLRPDTDVVLVGDLGREWVAREIALKLEEAAYLRARAFGLEEFLHGPRISVGTGSLVVAFTDRREPRWKTLRDYLRTVEVPLHEYDGGGLPAEVSWLSQLFWGQRLALEACRQLGVDPDDLRSHDPRYRKARERLSL